MKYVGYRFQVDSAQERDRLCTDLRAVVCDTLHLCASVGCACVTGVGDKLCQEIETGGSYPIFHSQGPRWSVVLVRLPQSVKLDVYTDDTFGVELSHLYECISERGWAIFRTDSSGAFDL